MDAIILGGGGKCPADDKLCPSQYRSLLELCGRPMIDYVVEAIRDSRCIEKIYLVGDPSIYAPLYDGAADIYLIPEGKNIVENICAALCKCEGHTLLATIDIPLITGQTVRDFIAQCLKTPDKQFFYPVVEQSVNEKAYPETKRTYFRMKEGNFTGGNLMLLHTDLLKTHKQKFEDLFAHRKSAVKMALDIGIFTVLKMLTGHLSLAEAEKRCCKVLDIKGRALVSEAAELCLDVDKPSDYREAIKNLQAVGN